MRAQAPKPPVSEQSGIPHPVTPVDLLSLFRAASIGVSVIDRRLHYVAVNPALAVMNGLCRQAHVGRPVHEVLGFASSIVIPVIERALRTGQPISHFEFSAKLPARSETAHWTFDLLPLPNEKARVTNLAGFVTEFNADEIGRRASELLADIIKITDRADLDLSQLLQNGMTISGVREGERLVETLLNEYRRLLHQAAMQRRDCANGIQGGLQLSLREMEVVRLLAQGHSNKEISSILGISIKTVETYRFRIKTKLNIKTVAELVHYAIRHNIVPA